MNFNLQNVINLWSRQGFVCSWTLETIGEYCVDEEGEEGEDEDEKEEVEQKQSVYS